MTRAPPERSAEGREHLMKAWQHNYSRGESIVEQTRLGSSFVFAAFLWALAWKVANLCHGREAEVDDQQ